MAAPDVVIRLTNVTKKFRIYEQKNTTLKEKIMYLGHSKYHEYTALDNVSLDIVRGSTVGLIGANGSGKSTLLKIASRILYPDSGDVEVHGRVSSLLELGAGFHPDFTGVENIYMNGALLGLSKKEISKRLDEIIDFSELGDFIHQPVRSYSSGMYMRLAFSVAVTVDPEILLIDEILAVGDAAFQAKCMSRLRQLQSRNRTIILVTHDVGAVEKFCSTAIWLDTAQIKMQGEPVPVIQSYLDKVFSDSRKIQAARAQDLQGVGHTTPSVSETTSDERWGSKDVLIESVRAESVLGENIVRTGDNLSLKVAFRATKAMKGVVFGIGIFSESGVQVYGTNTLIDRVGAQDIQEGRGTILVALSPCDLLAGHYYLDLAVESEFGEPYDYWRKCLSLQVTSDRNEQGITRLSHEWNLVK